jgi:glucosamine-6-phosphate deaminase
MLVVVLPDARAVSLQAAAMVADVATRTPRAVLGLAAGATPVGLYHELARRHAAGLDLSGVTAFALDEYLDLAPDHPARFARAFHDHLLAGTNLPAAALHLPDVHSGDLVAACAAYDQAIAAAGGIDLQILGIGGNGHIGFNEPGSSLAGRTRPVRLSVATRAANAGSFRSGEAVPEAAVTMGIGTILAARRIVLLATGANKAAVVAAAIEGPVTARLPASALQLHPDVTVVLDEAAANRLDLRAHYDAEAAMRRKRTPWPPQP